MASDPFTAHPDISMRLEAIKEYRFQEVPALLPEPPLRSARGSAHKCSWSQTGSSRRV